MRGLFAHLLLLLVLPAAVLAAEAPINPHLKDENGKTVSCDGCHKPHGDASGGAGSTTMLLLEDTETKLCLRCHLSSDEDHPVDIVPKKAKVPSELPLGKDGKIVCSTCHDSHGTSKFPKLLRANAQVLCTKCHEQ